MHSEWFRQLHERLRAPYVGIWLFWRPALVMCDPDLARNVLLAHSDNFRDRFVGTDFQNPIESQSLFMAKDPLWSSVRRRLTPVFTSAKLKPVQDVILLKAHQLVTRISREIKYNKDIDLRSLYADYSTDIISIAAFGVAGDATLTGTSPMRDITKEFMKYSFWRGISWFCLFFWPQLGNVFPFRLFSKETTDYLRRIFNSSVKKRGGYTAQVGHVRDFADALIKMKQDAAVEGEDMTEELLVSQATIFVQGGFDASAVALAYATYELAFAPKIQDKLYLDLTNEKQKQDSGKLHVDLFRDNSYLDCVIKEILRKYSGWLDRVATNDYEVDEHLTIPAGTPVYINSVGMHYDGSLFEEPEQFRPERFLPENVNKLKPYSYLPFGEGPRHCIGVRLGHQIMRHALAYVILHFEVLPKPNSPKPSECEYEKKGLFVGPRSVLSVNFIPRITKTSP